MQRGNHTRGEESFTIKEQSFINSSLQSVVEKIEESNKKVLSLIEKINKETRILLQTQKKDILSSLVTLNKTLKGTHA